MDEEKTLLQETEDALGREKLSGADVQWVGSGDVWFDWSEFVKLASGTGAVPGDLVIVGKDWWFDRLGANKGWTLSVQRKDVPAKPAQHFVPSSLFGRDTVLPDDARELFAGQEIIADLETSLTDARSRVELAKQGLSSIRGVLTSALEALEKLAAKLGEE